MLPLHFIIIVLGSPENKSFKTLFILYCACHKPITITFRAGKQTSRTQINLQLLLWFLIFSHLAFFLQHNNFPLNISGVYDEFHHIFWGYTFFCFETYIDCTHPSVLFIGVSQSSSKGVLNTRRQRGNCKTKLFFPVVFRISFCAGL